MHPCHSTSVPQKLLSCKPQSHLDRFLLNELPADAFVSFHKGMTCDSVIRNPWLWSGGKKIHSAVGRDYYYDDSGGQGKEHTVPWETLLYLLPCHNPGRPSNGYVPFYRIL